MSDWKLPNTPLYTPEQYQYEKIIGKRKADGAMKLKRLKAIHRVMIAHHLRGMSNRDIAFVTGFDEFAIGRVLRDPLSQAYIQEHLSGTEMELAALQPMAVDAVRRGLNSDDDRTALNAADKFFKATGQYAKGETSKDTAEDVIVRALGIMESQAGAINQLARPNVAERMVDITPSVKQIEANEEN